MSTEIVDLIDKVFHEARYDIPQEDFEKLKELSLHTWETIFKVIEEVIEEEDMGD